MYDPPNIIIIIIIQYLIFHDIMDCVDAIVRMDQFRRLHNTLQ